MKDLAAALVALKKALDSAYEDLKRKAQTESDVTILDTQLANFGEVGINLSSLTDQAQALLVQDVPVVPENPTE